MTHTFTNSPLDVCLQTSYAHARIQRALDEELAWAHGLSYQDFVALTALSSAPEGRLSLMDLVNPLGLPVSGVLRLMLPLEKTGLIRRETDAAPDGKRYVILLPAGKAHLRNATVTAQAACASLLASWIGTTGMPAALEV